MSTSRMEQWVTTRGSLPFRPSPFPIGVTRENWPGLRDAGWRWLTNLFWPFVDGFIPNQGSIYEGVKARHGEANVLLGLPWDPESSQPVQELGGQVGVYVLENLQLPEAVRKFIAEHEENPL